MNPNIFHNWYPEGDMDPLHLSVACSYQDIPTNKLLLDKNPIMIPLHSPPLKIFNNYLVVVLKNNALQKRHEYFLSRGFTSKWDEYHPHISLESDMTLIPILPPLNASLILGPEIITSNNGHF